MPAHITGALELATSTPTSALVDALPARRALSSLVDAARELALPNSRSMLLQVVARRARQLLHLDMAYIGLLDDEQDCMHVHAADGQISDHCIGLRLPATGGLGNVVSTHTRLFWTPDYFLDERLKHTESLRGLAKAEGLHAMIAVPLKRDAALHAPTMLGVLYLADRRTRQFTAEDCSLISSFGELAAAAIERSSANDRVAATTSTLKVQVARAQIDLQVARDFNSTCHELIDVVLGGDVQELIEDASKRLDGALRMHAFNGAILHSTDGVPRWEEAATVKAAMAAHDAGKPIFIEPGMWVAPIIGNDEQLGTLFLWPNHKMTEADMKLLRLVSQAAAVLLKHNATTAAVHSQIRDELLDDLLSMPPRPPLQLKRRSRQFSIDLDKPHVVVVAQVEGETHSRVSVWAASYAQRLGGLTSTREDCVVFLLPGRGATAAARAVSEELSSLLGQQVTAGGGGPVTGSDSVHRGYQEALRCLRAIVSLGAIGQGASMRELGFLGVLLSDGQDVAGFVDSMIGPVIDYDRRKLTELTRTLVAYFETGRSPMQAAEKLHVHPNTIARRLERVKELLGADWQNPHRILDIQLALRLFKVRDALGEDLDRQHKSLTS